MRPQATTKLPKRPCRKGPTKDMVKKKPKPEPDKKRKIIIKKLISEGKQNKSTSAKLLTKVLPSKIIKTPPKTVVKQTISKPISPDSKNENTAAKNKQKSPSPGKTKTAVKKTISPQTNKPVLKVIKKIPVKNIKKTTAQDKSIAKLPKSPKKVNKTAGGKEKTDVQKNSSSLSKNVKDLAKTKKVADPVASATSTKLDRSRCLEKNRLGVIRSSSAPLLPSKETIDNTVKDNNIKPIGTTTRTNKASLENIAMHTFSTSTNSKTVTNKKIGKTIEPKDLVNSQPKSKDVDTKSSAKSYLKADLDFKSVRPLWTEESKSSDPKVSELDNKTPKKLVGKVKPIARVKGTIIEKKTELDKKKITSPIKTPETIKPLVVAEKDVQNITEIESKKDASIEEPKSKSKAIEEPKSKSKAIEEPKSKSKTIEESKKAVCEKESIKIQKSTKKQDPNKTPTNGELTLLKVQPDITPKGDTAIKKVDSQPVKALIKKKDVALIKKKKKVMVNKVRLIPKGTKTPIKQLTKNKCVTTKTQEAAPKPAVKIVPKAKSKEPINKVDAEKQASVEKSEVKLDKSPKSKPAAAIKTSTAAKPKLKDIPKKIKLEPKDHEVKNQKEEPSSIIVQPTITEVKSSDAQNDANKTPTTPEKVTKAKAAKKDRSPSPKLDKRKTEEPATPSVATIKKEKLAEKATEEKSTPKKSLSSDKNKEKKKILSKTPVKTHKKIVSVPTHDNISRKKLLGFWTGPKRHREASLNALAKVQCLYENENRTHLELGLMRTVDAIPPRMREISRKKIIKTEKHYSTSSESEYETRVKTELSSSEDDSNPPTTRTLRCQPGSRGTGKYWEMKISSSEESEAENKKHVFEKRKMIPKPKVVVKTEGAKPPPSSPVEKEKKVVPTPPVKRRRKRVEIPMDLKDMVVKKRMASLNASAILAASYEKRSPRSGRDETTSASESTNSEQEEILAKKCRLQTSGDRGESSANKDFANKDVKSTSKSKVEVIVNQEADVTITGVYSHHEGFCTVSQYRISATSHTQTTATASSEKELSIGGSGPTYTPLGALSSMHPPGGAAVPHLHPGAILQDSRGPLVGSLGRRAGCSSAFSAPHHHADDRSPGYYQPAGPLITAAPLHGGFKDGGGPPPLPAEQLTQFGRYSYPQPQQVVHYGGSFGGQYGSHAHYGGAEVCYGAGRAPGAGPVPPAPSCFRPPPAHRTSSSYRHGGSGTGSAPTSQSGSHDSQISPAAPEAYAPQYCPPCYQHPHPAPRAPIAYLDAAYQGPCPCPMQSCSKNVHTGPVTGNPPTGAGPNLTSPPGGSRAPTQSILGPPASSFCIDDKRKAKISNGKDLPLLNQVLKNECNIKNGPELRSGICQILDNNSHLSGRSPKREYFPEQVTGRRQEVSESRGSCCPVAINPSLSVMPPEAHGPPSPARGSAGACIPQPPDPPHPCHNQSPSPLLTHNPPTLINQRRARVGKAMARKSIGVEDMPMHNTMLLMCQPQTVEHEVIHPKNLTSPLQVITEPIESKSEDLKSDGDSSDDIILIDSPSSKMAPIDLSSSDETVADGKSDKDCEIVTKEPSENVIDLSVDTKKENSLNVTSRKNGSIVSDVQALKEHNIDKNVIVSNSMKKLNETKSKVSTKRRSSQPKLEIDLDVQIDDNLAANGIGEHVKLQKRQKVAMNQNKKNLVSGSYKDLIKKPDKVFKLNNGKRQLNTIKVEKTKPNKTLYLMDTDKLYQKKISNKRKSPVTELSSPVITKRKKSNNLLKYADKKQLSRTYDEITDKPIENCKKSAPSIMPKNKSDKLLENLMMKQNNIDPVIENVEKVAASDESGSSDPPTTEPSPKKAKKDGEVCGVKSRTVLNINNNVVKKMNDTDCTQVPTPKDEANNSNAKQPRTKSKSPAAPKSDKQHLKDANIVSVKAKTQPNIEVKDVNAIVSKCKKATKTKIGPMAKNKKKKSSECPENEYTELPPARRLSAPRWSNGWTWEGEPQQGKVFINNEDTWLWAWCYTGMRHSRAGDSVKRGDCVLLRAGARRTEAPFVARVTQLWENPTDGEMMVSLLWYYRPEHTDGGRQPDDCAEEVFASRHRDSNSVACIEDKCYVLTFNEYCRYRKQVKAAEENIVSSTSIVPSMPISEVTPAIATNDRKVPFNVSPDLVLFSRRIYDFRLKRIVKPPN